MRAADTLVKYGGSKLLFKNYRVKIQSLNSKMTCMHILCENGETEWVKRALNELNSRTKKDDFLQRMVLKKIATHRIRNFSCLHLAAMNGHTGTVHIFPNEKKKLAISRLIQTLIPISKAPKEMFLGVWKCHSFLYRVQTTYTNKQL